MTGNHIDVYVETHPETDVIGNNYRQVWLAEDVTESNSEYREGDALIINAIANVPGEVNVSESSSSTTTSYDDGSETIETVTITTISNEYDVGEEYNVYSKEDEFVELFEEYPEAKRRIKPRWLVRCVEKNATQMLDLTKFLVNKVMDEEIFPDIDRERIFERYRENEFIDINRNGRISYESLNITNEDRQILYRITSAERGDGTQEQQEYVVSVILNRVLSSQFPNTVRDVVFARMQFQPIRNGAYEAAQPSQVTRDAVDNVIENGGTAKTAVYFMTPAASLTQGWLNTCIFLFNDEDDNLRNTDNNVTHNFYTTESIQAELEQYMMSGSGDILEACEDVMNVWMARGVHYRLTSLPTTLQQAYETSPYGCCATYVSTVLYRAGLLDESDVVGYAWHYTGNGGVPDMLLNKGWREITNRSDIQPGDVLDRNEDEHGNGHVAIYAGNGLIYDQKCAVWSSSGAAPTGGPRAYGYERNSTYRIYRAP